MHWRRWRLPLGAAVVALVLGTAAIVGWRAWQEAAAEDRGTRFAEAMRLAEDEQFEQSARAFAEFAEAEGGEYGALARLRQAAMLSLAGDSTGAVTAYNALIDSGADPLYAELAEVFAAQHLIDRGETRGAERRLTPIAEGVGPWRFLAREMLAVAALQDGRLAEARKGFQALQEEAGVPQGVRLRARQLTEALGGAP